MLMWFWGGGGGGGGQVSCRVSEVSFTKSSKKKNGVWGQKGCSEAETVSLCLSPIVKCRKWAWGFDWMICGLVGLNID